MVSFLIRSFLFFATLVALNSLMLVFFSSPIDARKCIHEIQYKKRIETINKELGVESYVLKDLDKGSTTIVKLSGYDIGSQPSASFGSSSTSSSATPNSTWIPPPIYLKTVKLPINHFGVSPDPGKFSNRYWVIDKFYKPGGPVFTFDGGETDDTALAIPFLVSNRSFFLEFLQEFNGLGILWEHRYYGKSNPYPVNLNTTAAQLQYLTIEQALADFDYFARGFKWKLGGDGTAEIDFNPKKVPWIHVGGSYPGVRAAMLREKYPETVFAAYASSAPVEARVDMRVYFEQVYRGMVSNGLRNCTESYKSAIDYIDNEMSSGPKRAAKIKTQFLGRTAERNSNEGFADTLYLPIVNWQSVEIDFVLNGFCNMMEYGTHNPNATVIAKGGISNDTTLRGLERGKLLAQRWANWPTFVHLVNQLMPQTRCEGPKMWTNGTLPDCRLDERVNTPLSIAWTWQYCTQFGYLQATNKAPGQHPIGSKFNTLAHQRRICFRQFPTGLPPSPRVWQTNQNYGGWYMRPSNTFWTDGEFDPWRTLSLLSDEVWSPRFAVSQKIPKCNLQRSIQEPLFGYLLPNAAHVWDFRAAAADSQLAEPRKLFAAALREWLKCFPGYEKRSK